MNAPAFDISPCIEARSLADHSVALAVHLAQAADDWTGVYADAARHDLQNIEERLTRIKAAVAKMPTSNRKAA